MNDYQFGNYIYSLRKKQKISQQDLADILGVTNKAVSKWENGKAKPTTNVLRKMASYFQIPVEELLIRNQYQNLIENIYIINYLV